MGEKSHGRGADSIHRSLTKRGGNADVMRRAVAHGLEALESRWLFAAVATDKDDYVFGEVARITGIEFAAGETIQLQVTHVAGTAGSNDDAANAPWTVQADAAGSFLTTWLVNDPD